MGNLFRLYDQYKNEYDLNISEGLIKTINIGQTVYHLKKEFPEFEFKINKTENDFTVFIYKAITINVYEKFKQKLNNLGWFISHFQSEKYSDIYNDDLIKHDVLKNKYIFLKFNCEAKYDIIIDKIPNKLYHITPQKNVHKILEIGLSPKSRSKLSTHPERIYLTKTLKDAKNLKNEFIEKIKILDWSILEINTKFIPNYFTLYQDPNFITKGGYYTLNNIPPRAIIEIKIQ